MLAVIGQFANITGARSRRQFVGVGQPGRLRTMSSSTTDPTPGATQLSELLTLAPGGTDPAGQDTFEGRSSFQPHGRVFGGQVLAQALIAAAHTVPEGRPAHSMHAYFLRPGELDIPLRFSVERLRDGRSFSARRIHVTQNDTTILSSIASFQTPGDGPDHALTAPDVPGPESLPTTAQVMAQSQHPVARYWAQARPIDIRHVEQPLYFAPADEKTDVQMMWLRPFEPLPDVVAAHHGALAYASDYTLLESVLRRHGLSWSTPALKGASLDHAMHWHRPFSFDEWVLCVQSSPSASGARGLTRAEFFTHSGGHIASVTQELMIRVQ